MAAAWPCAIQSATPVRTRQQRPQCCEDASIRARLEVADGVARHRGVPARRARNRTSGDPIARASERCATSASAVVAREEHVERSSRDEDRPRARSATSPAPRTPRSPARRRERRMSAERGELALVVREGDRDRAAVRDRREDVRRAGARSASARRRQPGWRARRHPRRHACRRRVRDVSRPTHQAAGRRRGGPPSAEPRGNASTSEPMPRRASRAGRLAWRGAVPRSRRTRLPARGVAQAGMSASSWLVDHRAVDAQMSGPASRSTTASPKRRRRNAPIDTSPAVPDRGWRPQRRAEASRRGRSRLANGATRVGTPSPVLRHGHDDRGARRTSCARGGVTSAASPARDWLSAARRSENESGADDETVDAIGGDLPPSTDERSTSVTPAPARASACAAADRPFHRRRRAFTAVSHGGVPARDVGQRGSPRAGRRCARTAPATRRRRPRTGSGRTSP